MWANKLTKNFICNTKNFLIGHDFLIFFFTNYKNKLYSRISETGKVVDLDDSKNKKKFKDNK